MSEMIAKIALGPLLLAQGLYTRWVTPKLPEAYGERQGRHGTGSELRVLIVGDSAAAGVGVAYQRDALAGQLVSRLGMTHQVSWRLLAQSGFDTGEVLQLLERTTAERFDVAVVSLGVNDVTSSRVRALDWIAQQGRLIDLLGWKFGVRQVVLSPVPPMHTFPALPQPLRWFLGRRAKHFNSLLSELVARRSQCSLLTSRQPVATSFMANLMAEDGFHPGPVIYSMWADDTVAAIRQQLDAIHGVPRVRKEA